MFFNAKEQLVRNAQVQSKSRCGWASFSCFVLAFWSLAILFSCSTIEEKCEKKEDCEQCYDCTQRLFTTYHRIFRMLRPWINANHNSLSFKWGCLTCFNHYPGDSSFCCHKQVSCTLSKRNTWWKINSGRFIWSWAIDTWMVDFDYTEAKKDTVRLSDQFALEFPSKRNSNNYNCIIIALNCTEKHF